MATIGCGFKKKSGGGPRKKSSLPKRLETAHLRRPESDAMREPGGQVGSEHDRSCTARPGGQRVAGNLTHVSALRVGKLLKAARQGVGSRPRPGSLGDFRYEAHALRGEHPVAEFTRIPASHTAASDPDLAGAGVPCPEVLATSATKRTRYAGRTP